MSEPVTKSEKYTRRYMRYLHNKIGFFIVGLVIIYGLSGILQTYRDTDLLKHEVLHQKQLAPALSESKFGPELRMRNFKVTKSENNILYFQDGTYDAANGITKYATKEWYSWVTPFTQLHKSSSHDVAHYFTTLFAVALLFMSVSAFWMFKPGTKLFSSGVYLTITGIVAAVILLFLK